MTKIALITGAARRIGANIARLLHKNDTNIALHYRSSAKEASILSDELNRLRINSAICVQADLSKTGNLPALVQKAAAQWEGLDILVNNASLFYPTPVDQTTETQWSELTDINLIAPFFLSQAAAPFLKLRSGSIINIIDIHAERSLAGYSVYSVTKAGLTAMTRALAKELAPEIRVNGVAPGAIMWPEREITNSEKSEILKRIVLQRIGTPEDIAKAVLFLIKDADYVTGQILAVDGGRSLFS